MHFCTPNTIPKEIIMATSKVNQVVLSGDIIDQLGDDNSKVILGPGLKRFSDKIVVCKCGVLKKKDPNTYWVENHQKRYVPARGETIVGVITNKSGDIFKVDIGASEQASLSYLAFEGATKKNRPDVQVGDVVFAKLLVASRDMEPELVCVDSYGKKRGLGIVPAGGFLFTCSLNLVRKILNPSCPLLELLGKEVKYEIAVGLNGKIWVNAHSVQEVLAVADAILQSEYLTNDQIMFKSMFKRSAQRRWYV